MKRVTEYRIWKTVANTTFIALFPASVCAVMSVPYGRRVLVAVFVVNALSVAAGLMTYATMSTEEREEVKK